MSRARQMETRPHLPPGGLRILSRSLWTRISPGVLGAEDGLVEQPPKPGRPRPLPRGLCRGFQSDCHIPFLSSQAQGLAPSPGPVWRAIIVPLPLELPQTLSSVRTGVKPYGKVRRGGVRPKGRHRFPSSAQDASGFAAQALHGGSAFDIQGRRSDTSDPSDWSNGSDRSDTSDRSDRSEKTRGPNARRRRADPAAWRVSQVAEFSIRPDGIQCHRDFL